MSENIGLHVQITGEASSFSQTMSAARQKLAELAVEERKLKIEIATAEKELEKQIAKFGKDSTEANKVSAALAALYKKELELRDGVKSVTDDINRQTNAFKNNANQSKTTADVVKSGFMLLKGLALGYAGKTLYEAIIGSNAEFEQYMTSFEVLLGSADEAQSMMDDLNRFGAKTPFELTDVTAATEQLLAFGVAEEDIMTRLQQLGDLSKGQSNILERITLAYGKMLAKGKVSLEELNMLTEAGVPILKELASQYGVTQDALFKMISNGEVNVETINKAMQSMTSEGGQFFGMMEKQSQTFEGLMSTMSDNASMFAREVGDEAFEYLKGTLGELMQTIDEMNEDGSLSEIAGTIGTSIGTALEWVGRFINLLWG